MGYYYNSAISYCTFKKGVINVTQINIKNVQKSVNNKNILKSANLNVSKGEICALLGPNGVGKTTLLKCLLGLIFPDQGAIEIDNILLSPSSRSEILKKVGTVFQLPASVSDMTISDLFNEHLHYLQVEKPEPYDTLLKKLGLEVPLETKVGQLSLGMKQRLQLAMALSHKPNILVLDEPFNGLDIDGINLIKEILTTLSKEGLCVIIASHSLAELEDFTSTVVFILNGKTSEKKSVKDIIFEYQGGLREYYQIIKGGN